MRRLAPWMIVALGCSPGDSSMVTGDGSSSSSGQPADGSSEGSTAVASSSSSPADESSSSAADTSSSTGPSTTCGDGTLDADEACDDGNVDDGDACSSTCTVPFTIAWTQTVDGGAGLDDAAFGVAIADDGMIYVIGTVHTLADGDDIWVRQYAADGTEGWTIQHGGDASGYQAGRDIVVHPSGDLIVVGGIESAATGTDAWLLRLAAEDGAVVWQQTFDGAYDDAGTGFGDFAFTVAAEPGGDIVVGGRERAADSSFDFWMRRYDADGIELWTLVPEENGNSEVVEGVVVDAEGVSWMLGSEGLGDNNYQSWLRGFDAAGMLQGEQVFVGERLEDLEVTADGELVLCGRTPDGGTGDGVVIRLDPELATSWTHQHGGPAARGDSYLALAIAPGGDIHVVGEQSVMHRGVDLDMWIAKISGSDGSPIWGDTLDSEQHFFDRAQAVAVAPDGGIVVVGVLAEPGEDNNIFVRKYLEP